ncbi:4402_t:CDS:2 [Paraglomus brasilianum]|uniref:4402_t:CDS:1 n=1 Tax=Paraglomus brasilianum TaxID=144538 RepID=A0A9N9E3S6_9GLOM|nr:4402_t:CDS:2 [Paraglomus brasilianum]
MAGNIKIPGHQSAWRGKYKILTPEDSSLTHPTYGEPHMVIGTYQQIRLHSQIMSDPSQYCFLFDEYHEQDPQMAYLYQLLSKSSKPLKILLLSATPETIPMIISNLHKAQIPKRFRAQIYRRDDDIDPICNVQWAEKQFPTLVNPQQSNHLLENQNNWKTGPPDPNAGIVASTIVMTRINLPRSIKAYISEGKHMVNIKGQLHYTWTDAASHLQETGCISRHRDDDIFIVPKSAAANGILKNSISYIDIRSMVDASNSFYYNVQDIKTYGGSCFHPPLLPYKDQIIPYWKKPTHDLIIDIAEKHFKESTSSYINIISNNSSYDSTHTYHENTKRMTLQVPICLICAKWLNVINSEPHSHSSNNEWDPYFKLSQQELLEYHFEPTECQYTVKLDSPLTKHRKIFYQNNKRPVWDPHIFKSFCNKKYKYDEYVQNLQETLLATGLSQQTADRLSAEHDFRANQDLSYLFDNKTKSISRISGGTFTKLRKKGKACIFKGYQFLLALSSLP